MRSHLFWRAGSVMLTGLVVAFLWLSVIVSTADGALSDCIDATCRISAPGGGRGSGCVYHRDEDNLWVLTNAHVATSNVVKLEFWYGGHKSRSVSGRTVLRNPRSDAAVVLVDARQFGETLPSSIPIDPSARVQSRETIMSAGCAKGAWATGFHGHAIRYDGEDLLFLPIPEDGRSGSAIFDAAGERIVGLLRARDRETVAASNYGIATSAATLGRVIREHNTQCPPGGCPKYGDQSQSQWRIMPYRSEQDDINRAQNDALGSLYPTLPPQQARPFVPVQPPVDLRPLMEGIDRMVNGQDQIVQLLVGIRASQEAQPPLPAPIAPVMPPPVMTQPPLPPPDPDQWIGHDAMLAAEDVKADLEEAKEETSKLRTVVNTLIGDRDTLRDRIEERLEKVRAEAGDDASRRDLAVAYARDYAAEKLSGGAGLTMGKMVAGALGLSGPLGIGLAAAGWLAGRRLKRRFGGDDDGDGAGESRLSGLIDRVGDKVDNLKDRFRDTPPTPPPPQPAVAAVPQPTIITMPTAPAAAPQSAPIVIIPTVPTPVSPPVVPTVEVQQPSAAATETADTNGG